MPGHKAFFTFVCFMNCPSDSNLRIVALLSPRWSVSETKIYNITH